MMNVSQEIMDLKNHWYYGISPQMVQNIHDFVHDPQKPKIFSSQEQISSHILEYFLTDRLNKIDDDHDLIARYIIALLCCSKDYQWWRRVDVDVVRHYVPDLFDTYISVFEAMKAHISIHDTECVGLESFLSFGFTWNDIKEFCLDERHQVKGHYRYNSNLYLSAYLKPLILNEKNVTRLEQYILEYLQVNLSDFMVKAIPGIIWYDSYEPIAHYRRSLSTSQIGVIMDFIHSKQSNEILNLVNKQSNNGDEQHSTHPQKMKKTGFLARLGQLFIDSPKNELERIGGYFAKVPYPNNSLAIIYDIYKEDKNFHWFMTLLFSPNFSEYRQSSQMIASICGLFIHLDPLPAIKLFILPQYLTRFGRHKNLNMAIEAKKFLAIVNEYYPLEEEFLFCLLTELDESISRMCPLGWDNENEYIEYLSELVELGSYDAIKLHAVYLRFLTDEKKKQERSVGYYRVHIVYMLLVTLGPIDITLARPIGEFVAKLMEEDAYDWCQTYDDVYLFLEYCYRENNPQSLKNIALNISTKLLCYRLPIEYLQRYAHVFFNGKNNQYAAEFIKTATYRYSITNLIDVVVENPYLLDGFWAGFDKNISNEGLTYLLSHDIDCLSYILNQPNNGMIEYLKHLPHAIEKESDALLLLEFLKKPNKAILINTLKCIDSFDSILKKRLFSILYEQFDGFTADVKKNAIKAMSLLPMDNKKVILLLKRTQSPYSRALLLEQGHINFKELYLTQKGRFDLNSYLDDYYKSPKTFPVDDNLIDLVKTIDNQPANDTIKQLMLIYRNYEGFTPSAEALAIVSELDGESLQEFNARLLSAHYEELSDRKHRWLVMVPALHGDANIIKLLVAMIDDYSKGSRYQFAAFIMKLIGGSGLTEAYIALDRLGRTQKKKSLREAAKEACELGAKQRGINVDELGDLLVGDLGFIHGEIPFTYCCQQFSLVINNDLKFVIRKPDGKIAKSLPKPKINDDVEAADKVAKYVTHHKKLLRDMVKLQTMRLESAYTIFRQWSVDKWQNIFLHNPVMKKLASKLVWGIYQENKLTQTFIVNPSPVDCEDDVVILPVNAKIAIAHPLEIDPSLLKQWGDYFVDWKMTTLFEQLKLNPIVLNEDDENEYGRLGYKVEKVAPKPASTVINRLRKKGWEIGTTLGRGDFNTLYREIESLGIEIELSQILNLGTYQYESSNEGVFLEKIRFYQVGHFPRENGSMGELTSLEYKHLLLKKEDIPTRLAQELAREAMMAFE